MSRSPVRALIVSREGHCREGLSAITTLLVLLSEQYTVVDRYVAIIRRIKLQYRVRGR